MLGKLFPKEAIRHPLKKLPIQYIHLTKFYHYLLCLIKAKPILQRPFIYKKSINSFILKKNKNKDATRLKKNRRDTYILYKSNQIIII